MSKRFEALSSHPKLTVSRYSFASASAHHFSVREESSGIIGFGGDADPQRAQTKALYEWIERVVFRKEGKLTSSGWAAHSDPSEARKRAELELLERDAVLCSWLLRISPLVLGPAYFPAFGRHFPLLQFGQGAGFVVLGTILQLGKARMLLSTTATGPEEGLANLLVDAERAFDLLSSPECPVHPEMKAHYAAFCSASNESLGWLYAGGSGLSYQELSFEHETFEVPLWNGSKAWVVNANSNDLQPLFYGKISMRKINRSRLRRIGAGKRPLNRELHPIL